MKINIVLFFILFLAAAYSCNTRKLNKGSYGGSVQTSGYQADTLAAASEVHGRPVGIAILPDGAMLVSDDTSNTIWRVSAEK